MKKTTCKSFATLLVWLISCCFVFAQTPPTNPTWELITPKYGNHESVVAGYVLTASLFGNGANDATSYIQSCLNNLDRCVGSTSQFGGGVVYLKEGNYKISGRLVIPKGVTLRGDWEKPEKGKAIKGTILQAYYGKGMDLSANGNCDENGNTSHSFISMRSGSAVMDLAIWYPEQSATAPSSYPPSIQMGVPGKGEPGAYNVKNVTLVNSYYGVTFHTGASASPTINGLYGTPLKQGVEMDFISDVGRIEHCYFSPLYWASSGLPNSPSITNATYLKYLYDNATGIVMRRNDWTYTCYLDVEGYNKGFHTRESRDQGMPNGHHYGFNFTNCKYGLYYASRNSVGCMFTEIKTAGCEFGAYFSQEAGDVVQLYKWNLSATKCAIYTDKASTAKITMMESTIKAGKVLLQGSTLIAVNNDFNNPRPQIEFEASSRGDMIGNRTSTSGGWNILQNSDFENIINHDQNLVKDLKPLPAYREFIPQFKKPSRYEFYNAVNAPYNAVKGTRNNFPATGSATIADATASIQNALNKAGADGGGIVYLPPGHYRIDGQLNIPSNVELKGGGDISAVPMGPGSILEIYNTATPAVIMQANSGMRGIEFNYPTQVYCTVMPNPIDFPFTIRGNGSNIYIVNVGMRAANRAVDFATNRCDNFYIDFLTGYFFREGVAIKNSDNGILANMQCNTIIYHCGYEEKFGQYPNSNRDTGCNGATPAQMDAKDDYLFNSVNLTFLSLENVNNILLYNDFNFNAAVGMHIKSNVNGLALGFALDDDRTALLLDGSNINLDFINLQCVALQNGASNGLSTYFKSTSNYTANSTINLFNSDYWGYAGASGIIMGGAGTINLYGANFAHSGVNYFADVSNGKLNVIGSVISGSYSGTTYRRTGGTINTTGSLTNGDSSVTGTANITNSPGTSTINNISRNGWSADANVSLWSTPNNAITDNNSSWNCGPQNANPGNTEVWWQVDMKTNQTFNQIIFDYSCAWDDGPQQYKIEISTNGSQWTQVASGSNAPHNRLVISFETLRTARYIKITKAAGTTKSNYWAICNFYIANRDFSITDLTKITAIPDGTTPIGGVPVTSVSINPKTRTVMSGETVTFSATVLPVDATIKTVTYSITSGADLGVLNGNVLTTSGAGTIKVRANSNDPSKYDEATIEVTVADCTPILYNAGALGWVASSATTHTGGSHDVTDPVGGHGYLDPNNVFDYTNQYGNPSKWIDDGMLLANTAGNYFMVNMKQVLPISKIVIDYTAGQDAGDYVSSYAIDISNNNVNWTNNHKTGTFGNEGDNKVLREIILPENTTAQYFRIRPIVKNAAYWSMTNMYVYHTEYCPCTPVPTTATITTGKETIAQGETTTITLASSLNGATYTLYFDGMAIAGSGKPGNGNNLVWTVDKTGEYTVKAIGNGTAYCNTEIKINDDAIITINLVVETFSIVGNKTVVGFFDTIGRELKKEPPSGVYIIKYSDGTTKKIVK